MNWTSGLAALWAGAFVISTVQSVIPVAWWFEPGFVLVEDARAGECAHISFDRQIYRPFKGERVVTFMKETSRGGFATYSTHTGVNDYRPGHDLPDTIDSCWWSWGDEGKLTPGRYVMNTLWTVIPDNGRPRQVARSSNVFEVRE